ncbi:MAG: hypothetical protein PHW01_00205 [Patescibacteria group bacterium]|nr:hypothetical protein [Patescibacteria group bacterium]
MLICKTIAQIQKLIKNSDDPHKPEELQVASRFVKFYNRKNQTNYILSEIQPNIDDSIDVLINSKSDIKKVLKLQIKTFDPEARRYLNDKKIGSFLRIVDQGECHPLIDQWKKEIIKLSNLDRKERKEIILLLDGFWNVTTRVKNNVTEKFKIIFHNSDFKEVWIVYPKNYCIRLS